MKRFMCLGLMDELTDGRMDGKPVGGRAIILEPVMKRGGV